MLDAEPDIDANQAEQRQCETPDLSRRSLSFRQRFAPQLTLEMKLHARSSWHIPYNPQIAREEPKRAPIETQQPPRAGTTGPQWPRPATRAQRTI